MRVLLIGGTGNISTAITRSLLQRGDDVVLYNRSRSKADIPAGYTTIIGDRTDHATFEAQMAEAGTFDCVIDMIGYHPDDARSVVRAFAGRTGQFIFCSTVDVFTKRQKVYPLREDAERKPLPSFPYAYQKAECEEILFAADKRGDFAVTILRPAQTYNDGGWPVALVGPGAPWLKRLRDGKPLIVLGNGMSLWCAAHRDDVAVPFVNAIGNPVSFGKGYNVTGEEFMTWIQYYQAMADAMGVPLPELAPIPAGLLHRAAPKTADWCVENFQHNNVFDNTAAREELGYRYTISWEAGTRRMASSFAANGIIDTAPDFPLYDQLITAWQHAGAQMVEEMAGKEG